MGAPEIEAFLSDLAAHRHVAASTQNQAFSAILYLYRTVLEIEPPRIDALRANGSHVSIVAVSPMFLQEKPRLLMIRFQGEGDTPARVLIFDAPAHAESFFREVDREVRAPGDVAKVAAIGAKHQIRFKPPAR